MPKVMIGLHEIKEGTEQETFACNLASELKESGVEARIFANRLVETEDLRKAQMHGVKFADIDSIKDVKGKINLYVALDEWAAENMPGKEIALKAKVDSKENMDEVVERIIGKVKKKVKVAEL